MKIHSPIRRRRARLEIIPLIDIMFFLLASFMMVSLQMQKIRALNASLPTATLASANAKPDILNLTVDKFGQIQADKKSVSADELSKLLAERQRANMNLPVYLSGTRDASHGSVVYLLDLVKRAGIQHVAIAVNPPAPNSSTP
jgi:biopolymer transport protein ExbD